MLSNLCFLGVNTILTIILTKTLNSGGKIDLLFFLALTLTAMGNVLLGFKIMDNVVSANILISVANTLYAVYVNKVN